MSILAQEVWGGTWQSAFLTSSQVLLMLLSFKECFVEQGVRKSGLELQKNSKYPVPSTLWIATKSSEMVSYFSYAFTSKRFLSLVQITWKSPMGFYFWHKSLSLPSFWVIAVPWAGTWSLDSWTESFPLHCGSSQGLSLCHIEYLLGSSNIITRPSHTDTHWPRNGL